MATETLLVGTPQTMNQNQIYAMPNRRVLLFTDTAAPTLQMSNDVAFALNVAVALTNGHMEIASAFLRCTSGNILVTLKEN